MGPARSRPVVLDAGALIKLDRGDPRMRELIRLSLETARDVVIPAGALGQAWRDASRQVPLAALLRARITSVDPLDEAAAKAAGILCGRSGTRDVIDASVVLAARQRDAVVVTTDAMELLAIDPRLDVEAV